MFRHRPCSGLRMPSAWKDDVDVVLQQQRRLIVQRDEPEDLQYVQGGKMTISVDGGDALAQDSMD
jgi:hypothetical protein